MPSNRPPALSNKAYVEIDLKALQDTGEFVPVSDPIIAPTITLKVPRGKFEITYTAELFNVMEKLGNKKIQVFKYLLENKDGSNALNTTIREIAKETKTSKQTVNDTLKILMGAGLLGRKGSVYMLSPHMMVKGNQQREAYLVKKFEEMSTEEPVTIDAEIEGQLSITQSGDIVERAVPVGENNA